MVTMLTGGLLFSILVLPYAFSLDYIDTSCNGSTTITTKGRLESSARLTYRGEISCTFHVAAPTGKHVYTLFRWFELEGKVGGACVDYVNFYDGSDLTATKINTDAICGNTPPESVTSSGSDLLISMTTDARANYRGFDMIFTAITTAPCSSDQFGCGNGICIDSTLACDNYQNCGDGTDEANCEDPAPLISRSDLGIIVGTSCGLVIFLVICIALGVYGYKRRKLRAVIREPFVPLPREIKETYPVTSVYRKWDLFGYRTLENHPTSNGGKSFPERQIVVDENSEFGSAVSVRGMQMIPEQGTSQA